MKKQCNHDEMLAPEWGFVGSVGEIFEALGKIAIGKSSSHKNLNVQDVLEFKKCKCENYFSHANWLTSTYLSNQGLLWQEAIQLLVDIESKNSPNFAARQRMQKFASLGILDVIKAGEQEENKVKSEPIEEKEENEPPKEEEVANEVKEKKNKEQEQEQEEEEEEKLEPLTEAFKKRFGLGGE